MSEALVPVTKKECKNCGAPLDLACRCGECSLRPDKSKRDLCHLCAQMYRAAWQRASLRVAQEAWAKDQIHKRELIRGDRPTNPPNPPTQK